MLEKLKLKTNIRIGGKGTIRRKIKKQRVVKKINKITVFQKQYNLMVNRINNYVNKLDNALIRPGRIDYILSFYHTTKEQIKVMFEKYRPKEINKFEDFYSVIKDKNLTIAILQKFLFDNRKENNIMKNINHLYKIINDHKHEINDGIIESMYS